MTAYGQFCPVSKAMELLDERWTLLVIRELLVGTKHFNDLRRGVPKMSPALLSKRLRTLTRAGVVVRRQDGGRVVYELTEAGQELRPIVEGLGAWGLRWVPELGDEDLDPHLLLWDIQRNIDLAAVPDGRTVIYFHFPNVPGTAGRWWIVISPEGVDVCDSDPGHDVTLSIVTSLRTLTCVWIGDRTWAEATREDMVLEGPPWARKALPRWLQLSPFAAVPRSEEAAEARFSVPTGG